MKREDMMSYLLSDKGEPGQARRDAMADAETLRQVLDTLPTTTENKFLAKATVAVSWTRSLSPAACFYVLSAARATFKAVPALRGDR